ncbi:hypothetical protein ACTXM3_08405 [Glutamicibacter arilaitensis]|uniref:hypothetical protein n=1 Tax=Glutamicibacter arilaitensis TaxID=256701 RepID=UPI003FD69EC8
MTAQFPNTATHVVVFDDGETGWWDAATESFGGDDMIVASAIMYAHEGLAVQLGHLLIGANNKSPLGIAGALASYNPGRAYFEIAPEEVVERAFNDDADNLSATE